ncbi:MAG: hypothetical protein U0L18_09990 [Acutalibacteraceae bacterium]|nr:hypothetical protein [Acutalibacteraceae bacterium]
MDSYITELKNLFSKENFKEKKDIRSAIEKAYADMSRRAQGHTFEMKEDIVNWLIKDVFNTPFDFKSQEDFNNWHKEICLELKKHHNNFDSKFGKIGRSQKVINMSFKYLACVDNTYNNVLPYCHMTLDSYTLNWFKSINKDFKNIKWSTIDDYEQYAFIQEKIRKHLDNKAIYSIKIGTEKTSGLELPCSPFEAEYIIWEGEKINNKYNSLLKEINNYKNCGKEKDKWLIGSLFDKFLG